MRHVEFFHKDHFEEQYHRVPPAPALAHFIDFFWETRFDALWDKYPSGFSDALFPNTGYTYLINLGTPFVMQLDDQSFEMRGDGFLPRPTSIECYHRPGNQIFGIKFRISPVIYEKKVNFSEYRQYIFPLSYLLDEKITNKIKKADSFEKRVAIATSHYENIVQKNSGTLPHVTIVREILDDCFQTNNFTASIEELAQKYGISTRTLQRYFEATTGISSKKALQIMRIRKAVAHLASSPNDFYYSLYGYYDYSHFYKHLTKFLRKETLKSIKPHLLLLKGLQR